jgi:hypothetical protein
LELVSFCKQFDEFPRGDEKCSTQENHVRTTPKGNIAAISAMWSNIMGFQMMYTALLSL